METMTFKDIEQLVCRKEDGQLEFKETTGQLDRGMETLCAFLNGEGGTVLFGVTDKGKITGQEVSDQTKRSVTEAIQRIEPLPAIRIFYVPVSGSGKTVIAIHAEEQRYDRPFTYKNRAYRRLESVTSAMPQETYNSLLMQRGGAKYSWESLINEELRVEDLDQDEIAGTVRLGIENGRLPETTLSSDIPVLLEKLDLSKNGKLKNAAAILFAKNTSDYPQCLLRMARFKGMDKNEFIDNQRVKGNLFKLLDAAMAFFFKHLSLSGKINGLLREEELTVPVKALRECCTNALCHRTYNRPGSSVGIAIYDDRIEIENSGTFPSDMTIEKLKSEHRSEPQNPLIADVLYKRKVLENWGRGIGLMIDECRRVGLPEPEFHTNGNFVWVVFRYGGQVTGQATDQVTMQVTDQATMQATDQATMQANDQATMQATDQATMQVTDQATMQVTDQATMQVTDQATMQVTMQVRKLVSSMNEQPLPVKEIMKLLSLNNRDYFRRKYLHPALEGGYIVPLYPEQPRSPKQKYCLTEKGRTLLK